ncbi:hypothetical protein YPPY66_0289, partial [Yersinia pestis PY-66]
MYQLSIQALKGILLLIKEGTL